MSTAEPAQLSAQAFTKIALHAAKFPSARVLGFLLAGHSPSGPTVVSDAVPLAHAWTGLAPALEAGAALVEAHAARLHLKIWGVYEVPAQSSATASSSTTSTASSSASPSSSLKAPPPPATPVVRLARRAAVRAGEATHVVVVDAADLLDPTKAAQALGLFSVSPTGSESAAPVSPAAGGIAGPGSEPQLHVARLLTKGQETAVVDFEDSLSDPALDWLANSAVPSRAA